MTVYANKPAFNVREKLKELEKPSGIAGEAMLRAETPQEQFNLIGAGRRNVIINGAAQISQRGDYSSATTVVNQTLYVDRWFADVNINSTFQHTDVDIVDMPTKRKAMKYVATTSGTKYLGTRQKVENPSQYEGRTFTYSAYVRSNHASARLTTYMSGSAQVEYSTAHSGSGQWERLSTTFTVKSGVTVWYLDVFLATQGIGQVAIATGDYFEVTGVQLELGKIATPFEHRSYGEELALCQRYYQHWNLPSYTRLAIGFVDINTRIMCTIPMPVQLRSLVSVGHNGLTLEGSAVSSFGFQLTNGALSGSINRSNTGLTVGQMAQAYAVGSGAYFFANGEL